ncbi:transcription initiation factor TFIIE alpha subunit [Punctularia strigosozonata HHB-11173 SS5]|uniref:transcription initiation factor TFIIE alpha subunit n=1 Tax=Punctularia strigosozonata (strain HHB-11173) TaxID=741275 RepID=UPI000441861C|nr:transcription initiation factor TFIIE alpha subunit [Punctularia strigosozonata HHB-11173 SS5]EIN08206.1 transcription initiation factor TFIIE alpha subunit [Punctularia strigosozonata HHB-11173 SS5]
MATPEEKETLRKLVQHVARAFYEPQCIIILDLLSRYPVMKIDELAGRMGVGESDIRKDLNRLCGEHKLIRVYRQNELKEGATRATSKAYYYVDYENFCNVVKWRIKQMHATIDSSLRNELDQKGYICNQCSKPFTTIDAAKLMDFSRGCFVCDDCQGELIENDRNGSSDTSDLMQRFNAAMFHIREGLRKTESMVLPAVDIVGWVKIHGRPAVDADGTQAGGAAANGGAGGELKIAGANGTKRQDEGVGVVLSLDGADEETKRKQREAQAAARQQQNALPSWHLKSTISGDLTALGIKESARIAAQESSVASSSNDEILRGLGTVRKEQQPVMAPIAEDVKPDIGANDADCEYRIYDNTFHDYDQYYASLAASGSSNGTPAIPGAGSDFSPEDDEDEDVKPNVELLNSLNDYRKRSRSRDDEGPGSDSKRLRGSPTVPETNGTTSTQEMMEMDEDMEGVPPPTALDGTPADDPIVYVNGEPMAFSQVTEEHQEMMTPEEYTAYFEVFDRQGT